MTAFDDNRIACADGTTRIEADVEAGRDYTVLLKGTERFEQGNYNIKLYDELGLGSAGGSLKKCQVVCPNIQPYAPGGTNAGPDCTMPQINTTGFTEALAPGNYYMSVKGRKANEKSFYELQIGDPNVGSNTARYTPRTWTEVRDTLLSTKAKVLPVLSCSGGSDCPQAQARALSEVGCTAVVQGGVTRYRNCAGPVNQTTGQGQYFTIDDDGTNIGSGLATAVRDLASYLSMDISVSAVGDPGFEIEVQKCTNSNDPAQAAVCRAYSTGCIDSSLTPKNTVRNCQPGSTPKFIVEFTNPTGMRQCPACDGSGATVATHGLCQNCDDPNGGYHFKLQLVGDYQYVLEEIPVYIIPTAMMGPGIDTGGEGTFMPSGSYEQELLGHGCNYYELEGEDDNASNSCTDGADNDGDGKVDNGDDANSDGDFDDAGDVAPEEGCLPGSCIDGIDNDGDAKSDIADVNCITNEIQAWENLYFKADLPTGTSISFDMCTGETEDELDGCSFSRIATVTSGASCATDVACQNVNVGGFVRSGFCGAGGQCQFIDPPKLASVCSSDAECIDGLRNGEWEAKFCNTDEGQCQYTTPPADIGANLLEGDNGKPFIKLRVNLNANMNGSAAPMLNEWYLTYQCISGT
jgi:hypothetical protein